jgi:hypothetical protein
MIASKQNTQRFNKKELNSIGVEMIVSKKNTQRFNKKDLNLCWWLDESIIKVKILRADQDSDQECMFWVQLY